MDIIFEQFWVKVMIDGILLLEIQYDCFFDCYDILIIDEVYECSFNIDFILGYLCQLLFKWFDLKVIIIFVIIEVEWFSDFFDQVLVIEVSG